jgi:hypothetical protein
MRKLHLLTRISALTWLLLPRTHGWANIYSSQSTYVQLDDGSLLSLNSSNLLGGDTTGNVESSFNWLTSPPPGSQLAVDGEGSLFAFYDSMDSSQSSSNGSSLTSAVCETSPMQISQYDASSQSWQWVAGSPANFVLPNSTIWSIDDLVYFFGGYCADTNSVTNTLVAFNTSSLSFFEPSNNSPPRGFSSAGAAQIANETVLLIGGAAGSSGWINLQQAAIWQFGSWSFRSASNSSEIDSRTNPLVVPIFASQGQPAEQVIVIGGSVDGRSAQPYFASLSISDGNAWTWSSLPISDNVVSGALSINGTFVTITTSGTNGVSKRSGLFQLMNKFVRSTSTSNNFSISMYDPANWNTVQSLVTNQAAPSHVSSVSSTVSSPAPATSTSAASSKSLSTGGIAAISTIFPLSFAGAAVVGVFMFRKKRKQSRMIDARTARLMSPVPSLGAQFDGPYPRDSDSVQSWNEKRARLGYEFDQSHINNDYDEDYDDDYDLMEGRDVQVLVSSQRRSRLRVANPDIVHMDVSDMSRTSSILGRQPSGKQYMHKRNKSDLLDN